MAERQLSRNHHTIPEFYQRGFRDVAARLSIVRYDKQTGFIEHPRMKQESVILDYYSVTTEDGELTDRIETDFLAKFEGSAKHVIDKMRQREPLTEDDRGAFSVFVALMNLRTPYMRQNLDRLVLYMMQRGVKKVASDPEAFSRFTSELEVTGKIAQGANNEEFRQELLADVLGDDYHKRWSVGPQFSLGVFKSTINVAEHILNMHWRIFSATESSKYFTSDNPVAIARKLEDGQLMIGTGPRNPDAEITFPVTKDLALVADHRDDRAWHYMRGTEYVVNLVNERTAVAAQRYVYAHVVSPELMKGYIWKFARVKHEYRFEEFVSKFEGEGVLRDSRKQMKL